MGDAADILSTISREIEAGRTVALCAIVATHGSTPQPAGTMICVDETATITGTLGGGCVEADVRRQAYQLLSGKQSKLLTFDLEDDAETSGMICGGQMDIAVATISSSSGVQPFSDAAEKLRSGQPVVLPLRINTADGLAEYRIHVDAPPLLLIAGAGHISRAIARLAVPLGFRIHVIDDRGDYANAERFAPPMQTTVGPIAQTLRESAGDANTYIVIVTRGHNHDEEALRAVLDLPATTYIGMLGSRRKIERTFENLRERGADEQQLARVHAPIGLDIGAVSAEEIALSIAAELVAVRRAGHHTTVDAPVMV